MFITSTPDKKKNGGKIESNVLRIKFKVGTDFS